MRVERLTMCLLGLRTCDSRSLVGDKNQPILRAVDHGVAYLSLGSVAEAPKRNSVWKAKKMK
jgi:hypothetical protein